MSKKPFDFKDYADMLADKDVQDFIENATEEYGVGVISIDMFMQALNDSYLEQIIVPIHLVELLARTRNPSA